MRGGDRPRRADRRRPRPRPPPRRRRAAAARRAGVRARRGRRAVRTRRPRRPPRAPSTRPSAATSPRLLTDGVRLQWAPGTARARRWSTGCAPPGSGCTPTPGLLGDGVITLDEAGLLLSDPVATYLVGTPALYAWADARGRAGHPVVHRIEHTHEPSRLAAEPPLVAVNTAVEVDLDGQVNVEGTRNGAGRGHRRAPRLRGGGHPLHARALGDRGRVAAPGPVDPRRAPLPPGDDRRPRRRRRGHRARARRPPRAGPRRAPPRPWTRSSRAEIPAPVRGDHSRRDDSPAARRG